jgi:HD-GYP domain-containing protein (c-di-GMP phosphodiesterase class II)
MVEFRKILRKDIAADGATLAQTGEPPAASGILAACATEISTERCFSERLFLEGIALNGAAFEWAAVEDPGEFPLAAHIDSLAREICDRLESSEAWKLLCITRARSEPDYLPAHSVSSAILSAHIGLRTNLPDERVIELAKIAFMHDIGMARIPRVWEKEDKLANHEISMIQKHPLESLKAIAVSGCCDNPQVSVAAAEHHERADGSGYPHGKTADNLSETSLILALVDVYLALTHNRRHRSAIPPFDAVRAISGMAGKTFPISIVRDFLKIMSLYPIGSCVRLNNGDIARVISSCERQLTRPSVKVIIDRNGFPVRDGATINLKNEELIFIREPVCVASIDTVFKLG